jgi:hypothetical protein
LQREIHRELRGRKFVFTTETKKVVDKIGQLLPFKLIKKVLR